VGAASAATENCLLDDFLVPGRSAINTDTLWNQKSRLNGGFSFAAKAATTGALPYIFAAALS
jgi:hypothetical protein